MKTSIFNFLFAGIFLSAAVITGCSKSDAVNDLNTTPQTLMLSNSAAAADNMGSADDGTTTSTGMFDRNLAISYASDGKTDMSSTFTGYTFKFTGTKPSGEALVTTSTGSQTGTWTTKDGADGTSMIMLDFQNTTLEQSTYLSRVWTMQPSTSPYTVNLVAPDGDRIQMTTAK